MNDKPILIEFDNKPFVMKVYQKPRGNEKNVKTTNYLLSLSYEQLRGFIKKTIIEVWGPQSKDFSYEISFHKSQHDQPMLITEAYKNV